MPSTPGRQPSSSRAVVRRLASHQTLIRDKANSYKINRQYLIMARVTTCNQPGLPAHLERRAGESDEEQSDVALLWQGSGPTTR
jgi:hypothetical protein